jgi:hypothetical protein
MSQVRLPGSSPAGRVYIPSSPTPEPEGITPFGLELKAKFLQYLQTTLPSASPTCVNRQQTNNRCIFSQAKKAIYRRWLQDPCGEVEGESIQARVQDRNARYDALKYYKLNQGCIYRKAPIRNRDIVGVRKYVALSTNAFEIIADEHRGLKHFGIVTGNDVYTQTTPVCKHCMKNQAKGGTNNKKVKSWIVLKVKSV